MLRKLISLWILIPILSSVYQVSAFYVVQPPPNSLTQIAQEAQNTQTFNAIVQLGVGSLLTAILLRLQRSQAKTNTRVEGMVADAAPKQGLEELQKQVKELENALALTNIQKQLVEVAQEQADTSRGTLALLTEFKTHQSSILDTVNVLATKGSAPVQRIDTNVVTAIEKIDEAKDIAIATADLANTSQEAILRALIEAVKEIKAAINKRRTGDSQQIVTIPAENGETKEEAA